MKYFIEICKMSQKELHEYLYLVLKEYGYEVYDSKKYILAVGSNILLTAHMDTVHKKNVKVAKVEKNKDGNTIISSPQGIGGDDRCGIYIILRLLEEGYRPTILFTEDEEIGAVGASKFIEDAKKNPVLENAIKACGYMIELDRANKSDAVFYDCDNPDFTKFIESETGFNETWGSFSDISLLAPEFERAAVNLSCGYYNAHKLDEYVVFEEMLHTIEVVKKLLEQKAEKFEYIEAVNAWPRYGSYSKYYGSCYDTYGSYYEDRALAIMVTFTDKSGNTIYSESIGYDENEALVNFFVEHPHVCFNDIVDFEQIGYY